MTGFLAKLFISCSVIASAGKDKNYDCQSEDVSQSDITMTMSFSLDLS